MAVVRTPSDILANVYATPTGQANADYLDGADVLRKTGTITVGATDSATSVYPVCQVSSGDFLMDIAYINTALGTSAAASLGLYQPNTSTAVSIALFATTLSMVAATTVPTSVRYTNLTATSANKRVWELLGLSKDPGIFYDLAWTLTTAGTGGGTIATLVSYSK